MCEDLQVYLAEVRKEAFAEGYVEGFAKGYVEGYIKGYVEGYIKEYAKGLKKSKIRGTVKSMRVDRKSDQEIIDRLVMLYDLSADEAEEALNVQMFQYEFLSVL
ncbi:MAG: hypothetical protein IJ088_12000 [Clostridia bacterium]|nr:hypothetical protein [Clostridia bacterium]